MKIKLFTLDYDTENDVNEFISQPHIEVVDIKISSKHIMVSYV